MLDEDAVVAKRAQIARGDTEIEEPRDGGRVDGLHEHAALVAGLSGCCRTLVGRRLDGCVGVDDANAGETHARRLRDAVEAGDLVGDGERDAAETLRVDGECQVAAERTAEGVTNLGSNAGGERAERGDERDADQHRSRGARRALRVAGRVLASHRAADAAQLGDRHADGERHRARDGRPEHQDAGEHAEHSETENLHRCVVHRRHEAYRAECHQHETDDDATNEVAGCIESGVAHCGKRRHATRTARRQPGGEHRDEHAGDHRVGERRQVDREAASGNLEARRLQQCVEALREQDADAEADQRADDAHRGGLDEQRSRHLTTARADGPHQGVLALSLRRGDREDVVDDERADAERDVREHDEEGREDVQHVLDLTLHLRGDLGTGERLELQAGGKRGIDALREHLVADGVVAFDEDRVDEPGLQQELRRGRLVEQRERGAARRRDVAVARDPDQGELTRAGERDHAHGVADDEVAVVSGRTVEHHLVRAERQTTFFDGPQAGRVGRCDATERRRTVAFTAERFTVFADDPGERLDVARRGSDALHAAHGVQHRNRRRRPLLAAEVEFEERGRAHVGVDVAEHVGEQPVERLVDRVAEDERAREKRRAENDGERGEHESALAGDGHLER